ncbi:hypothetical protein V6L77_21475 [Pannonibacter sp. Pt2-lr]
MDPRLRFFKITRHGNGAETVDFFRAGTGARKRGNTSPVLAETPQDRAADEAGRTGKEHIHASQ